MAGASRRLPVDANDRSPVSMTWAARLTSALTAWWTCAGGRPEGFAPVAGTKFRLLAKPKPGWSGVVDCEVLEVIEPSLLRYSWTGDEGGDVTEVVYRLEPNAGGTRFTYDHTGFTGVGGVFMAKLLGHVRRKMLRAGLPPVLDDLDEDGALRPGSTLRPLG